MIVCTPTANRYLLAGGGHAVPPAHAGRARYGWGCGTGREEDRWGQTWQRPTQAWFGSSLQSLAHVSLIWMLTDVIWLALVCSTRTACGQHTIRASQVSKLGNNINRMHKATFTVLLLSEAHIGH